MKLKNVINYIRWLKWLADECGFKCHYVYVSAENGVDIPHRGDDNFAADRMIFFSCVFRCRIRARIKTRVKHEPKKKKRRAKIISAQKGVNVLI